MLPSLPRSVLQRLGQVRCLDVVGGVEIGDGAGEFENSMIGTSGELYLLDGGFEHTDDRTGSAVILSAIGSIYELLAALPSDFP